MRISDWSSDVCSSDLADAAQLADHAADGVDLHLADIGLAAQLDIVGALDAALADAEFGNRQQRIAGEVVDRRLTDIADDVAGEHALGIEPATNHLDLHTRQVRRGATAT